MIDRIKCPSVCCNIYQKVCGTGKICCHEGKSNLEAHARDTTAGLDMGRHTATLLVLYFDAGRNVAIGARWHHTLQ